MSLDLNHPATIDYLRQHGRQLLALDKWHRRISQRAIGKAPDAGDMPTDSAFKHHNLPPEESKVYLKDWRLLRAGTETRVKLNLPLPGDNSHGEPPIDYLGDEARFLRLCGVKLKPAAYARLRRKRLQLRHLNPDPLAARLEESKQVRRFGEDRHPMCGDFPRLRQEKHVRELAAWAGFSGKFERHAMRLSDGDKALVYKRLNGDARGWQAYKTTPTYAPSRKVVSDKGQYSKSGKYHQFDRRLEVQSFLIWQGRKVAWMFDGQPRHATLPPGFRWVLVTMTLAPCLHAMAKGKTFFRLDIHLQVNTRYLRGELLKEIGRSLTPAQ
ncbi:MAG: hypothetical protein ACYDC1_20860 [Limisphaerales bacterium]